ncbi:hypothetical protein FEM03_01865 [Phragmitibacter flavus]|uniref:FecR protein domain-containing protein n=1 Tax=Phragmitibacter flavus TaxID=2576071 RepID=A0A5R8KKI2_9BACT|nr:FecR domain-containing protein [Phragmitibacter flavus]TLD72843.1 hypothetical protein FEM03_01865 [Phragmitibacter flavus]
MKSFSSSVSLGCLLGLLSWFGAGQPLRAADYTTPQKSQQDVEISKDSRVRLGSDSSMAHTKKKTVRLRKGALLVDDTAGFAGRGTLVETTEATASVKGGSFVAEYQEGGYLKIIGIAGKVVVTSKSLFAEFIELNPGKMLIISPSEKKLPEPVDIDLQRFVTSSRLMGGSGDKLANRAKLAKAIAKQDEDEVEGRIVKSPVVLAGRGLAVGYDFAYSAGSPAAIDAMERRGDRTDSGSEIELVTDTENSGASRKNQGGASRLSSPALIDYVLNSSTVYDPNISTLQTAGFPELVEDGSGYYRANNLQADGLVDLSSENGPVRLLAEGTFKIGVSEPATILLGSGNDQVWFNSRGSQTVVDTTLDVASGSAHDVNFESLNGNVSVDGSSLTANDIEFLANGGCLWMTNTTVDAKDVASGTVAMKAGLVDLNNVRVGQGQTPNTLKIEGGNTVSITNSSDLRALVAMTVDAPWITVANSNLQAGPTGDINFMAQCEIDLTNVTMSAQNVNLGVTGAGGLLHIKGSANQLLSLYANAGTIRFSNGAVSLSGQTINLTAQTVQIDNGTTVTNSAGAGGTNVNATNRNFNTAGFGSFTNPPP